MSRTGKASAVVIGASGAIGGAFEATLIEEGVFDVVYGFARSRSGSSYLDLLDEESIAAAAAHVAKGPPPTLVIVATGVFQANAESSEPALSELAPDQLAKIYAINAIGPALVAKHFLPIMPETGRAVFAALSARMGSISDNRLGGWYGYRASKAALNMLVRNLAIEERRRNDRTIVVALHPGRVDTALSRPLHGNVQSGLLFKPERAALQLLDVIEELKAPDSGKVFDFEGKEIAY